MQYMQKTRQMNELELRIYGDPVLRSRAEAIEDFGPDVRELADAMVQVMQKEGGIGLAAPQVGVKKRLIVALAMRDLDDGDAPPVVLVNPEVEDRSSDTWSYEEGCLSLPGITGNVVRPKAIRLAYRDVDGNERTLEAEGIFSRIILHEIDHLDGRLFIDYLSSAQKSIIKSKLKQLASGKHML